MMQPTRQRSVDAITKGVEFLFKKNKVDWLKGSGQDRRPGKVEVTAGDGTETHRGQEHRHRHRLRAVAPARASTSTRRRSSTPPARWRCPRSPSACVVIGAGIIGLELGSVWRRLGAEVTVVEFLDRITPGMDARDRQDPPALADQAGHRPSSSAPRSPAAKPAKTASRVTVEPSQAARPRPLEADVVLVAIGRRPYTEGLGLESVGVTPDRARPHRSTTTGRPRVARRLGDRRRHPRPDARPQGRGRGQSPSPRPSPARRGHVNYDIIPSVIYT